MYEPWNRPLAASGLNSFRYRSQWGWIMIGATDQNDALHQALRSLEQGPALLANLERWCILSGAYVPVIPANNGSDKV